MVVAEALALGTPVVCSDHPDNQSRALVSSYIGSRIPPFDDMALANATQHWLENTSQREDRQAYFLSRNTNLTIESLVKTYVRILSNG